MNVSWLVGEVGVVTVERCLSEGRLYVCDVVAVVIVDLVVGSVWVFVAGIASGVCGV